MSANLSEYARGRAVGLGLLCLSLIVGGRRLRRLGRRRSLASGVLRRLIWAAAALLLVRAIRAAVQSRRDNASSAKQTRDNGYLTHEVAEGVYRLALFDTNVYFIRSGSAWVLVDTGWAWGDCGRKIRQAAETLFGPGARPAAVLLTHIHPDHDGAALELATAWDCPVYVHPRELPMTTADLAGLEYYGNQLDRQVILPLLRAFPRQQVEAMRARSSLKAVAQAFDPGTELPGLPDWNYIATPGHSPGHFSLFRERDRVLVAGDAVLTVDASSLQGWLRLALRLGEPHVFAPPRYTNWDQRAADASLDVVAALAPRVLATSHGDPMIGDAVARELRALAERVGGGPSGVAGRG